MKTRLLHIHGQESQHDEAWVIGNKAALTALRDAIDAALASKSVAQATADVMAQDGEGYEVIVRVEDGPWDGEYWRHAAVPYSSESATGGNERDDVIWPFQRDPRYKTNQDQ